jgi:Beta-propeller repeat/Abnormal spindle-like microcephaly-assoc'd, ASPM-SPD-2-Hydin
VSHHPGNSPEPKCREQELVIELLGARKQPYIQPEDKLPGYSNYLFGSDPGKWITNVTQYEKVRYVDVYPGVDIVYHGNQSRLEHDFVVHPGADARRIALAFSGVEKMELSGDGDLSLHVADGEVRLDKPRAYQVIGKKEVEVAAEYILHHGYVAFRLGQYDATQNLVIDPVLVYATFLGGASNGAGAQSATSIAVDGSDNLYITGSTNAINFPVTPGVVQPTRPAPGLAAFVSKINAAGTALIYSTYIQGFSGGEVLAIDVTGNVYLAGAADIGLPIPAGSTPFQSTNKGQNVAILKLNNNGTAVLYGTYLGGSGLDFFAGIAVDASGDAYVSGFTTSNDFPTKTPLQGTLGSSGLSGFVAKLDPSGSGLVFSTYLGGNSRTEARGVALDLSGNAYIAGSANSGFPTTSGAFQPACSVEDCAFMAKLSSDGSSLLSASYLGGSDSGDMATAVAVDSSANIYLTGTTRSSNFPGVNGPLSCGDVSPSVFVAEFNAAGALAFSTCLGENFTTLLTGGFAAAPALALDSSGNVYVAARSDASLVLKNLIDSNIPATGITRSFISEVNPVSGQLLFSSFVGGSGPSPANGLGGEQLNAVAVDSTGNIYAAGLSASVGEDAYNGFPIFNALQPLFDFSLTPTVRPPVSFSEAVIMKISSATGSAAAIAPGNVRFLSPQLVGTTSAPTPVTVSDLGTAPLMISNVAAGGDFAVQSSNCGAVTASGNSCTIQVTFTPTAIGTSNGDLTITDSSVGSPHQIALTGQGGAPSASLSPTSLSFNDQPVGTTSTPQAVTLTNSGAINLEVTHIQASGDFSETNDCGTALRALSFCTIQVTFSPAASEVRTGSLTITDDAADSPQSISLTGNVPAAFTISDGSSPSSATVAAGATATFNLSLAATGGFSGAVQFTCSGAPAASNCTVAPNPITLSGANPTAVTVSIATTARTVARVLPPDEQSSASLRAFGLVLLPGYPVLGFVLMPIRRRTRGRRTYGAFTRLILMTLLCLGCGGGSNSSTPKQNTGTPAGTYNITVSGNSGGMTQFMMLKLTVQ